eukprot:1190996-Prorocentrum_minimum.AAC.3
MCFGDTILSVVTAARPLARAYHPRGALVEDCGGSGGFCLVVVHLVSVADLGLNAAVRARPRLGDVERESGTPRRGGRG